VVRALVLVGVALAVGLLVYWLASGHIVTRGAAPAKSNAGMPDSIGTRNVAPAQQDLAASTAEHGPIEPPKSAQARERETLESRRLPLYARLRQDLRGSLAAVRPSDDDAATLDLYAAQDTPGNTIALLNLALRDNVSYYGFNHIRFFAPNPAQSIERFRLDAEANSDRDGNWQTFKK
jgi:hypothetical protein